MAIMRDKNPQTPGVYIEEVPSGARPIEAVGTRTAGFVGAAPNPAAHLNKAWPINNWTEFRTEFFPTTDPDKYWTNLAYGVYGFFLNGGSRCFVVNVGVNSENKPNEISGAGGAEAGLDILARIDEIAIVAAPGYTDPASYGFLRSHCMTLHDRVAILDGPPELTKDALMQLGGEETDETETAPTVGSTSSTPKLLTDTETKKESGAAAAASAEGAAGLPGGGETKTAGATPAPVTGETPPVTVPGAEVKKEESALTSGEVALKDASSAVIKLENPIQPARAEMVAPPLPVAPPQPVTAQVQRGAAPAATGQWTKPGKSADGEITLYVPWIGISNPNRDPKAEKTILVPPSGHIAGVWARSDALRGVHKAPANEIVQGVQSLQYRISHTEQGPLNKQGVNCIRYFTNEGYLVWGARTYSKNQNWKYLNVRRLFNMIEESIAESTRWIVFEPNDRPLWNAIRRDVTAFLMGFWRDGALMGKTPEEAFYVKCDEENNPQSSIDEGRVVIEIGICPVKPAEFVMFKISQYEAGTDVEVGG